MLAECELLKNDPMIRELEILQNITGLPYMMSNLMAIIKPLVDCSVITVDDMDTCLDEFLESALCEINEHVDAFTNHPYGCDDRIWNMLLYFDMNDMPSEMKRIAILDVLKTSISFQRAKPGFSFLQLKAEVAFRRIMQTPIMYRKYQSALLKYKRFLSVVAGLVHAGESIRNHRYSDALHFLCTVRQVNSRLVSESNSTSAGLESDVVENLFLSILTMLKNQLEGALSRTKTEEDALRVFQTARVDLLPCLCTVMRTRRFDFEYVENLCWRQKEPIRSKDLKDEFDLFRMLIAQPEMERHYHHLEVDLNRLRERASSICAIIDELADCRFGRNMMRYGRRA
ncbi:hypothetical protein ACOME3_009191 [Neoechinorhynchus agilis]